MYDAGLLLVFLTIGKSMTSSDFRVVSSTVSVMVKEGSPASLFCRTSHDWFFCLWKPPVGKKECSIQERSSGVRKVCLQSGREEVAIQGSDSSCSLHIPRVTLGDHGNFLCLLNQAETFRTARSSVDLEVATEAGLSLRRRGSGESGVLEAVDGELVEVECRAVRAHPAPTLQWVVPGGVEEGAVVEEVEEAEGHTVTLVSRLTYRASSSHSSASIQCLSTQVDPAGGDILYSHSNNITLAIAQAAPLISTSSHTLYGIIAGILIAVALVFVILLLLLVFAVKQKKKKKVASYSPLKVVGRKSYLEHRRRQEASLQAFTNTFLHQLY